MKRVEGWKRECGRGGGIESFLGKEMGDSEGREGEE